MKKWILFLGVLLFYVSAYSQIHWRPVIADNVRYIRIRGDSTVVAGKTFLFPNGCGNPAALSPKDLSEKLSGLYADTCNHIVWWYDAAAAIWDTLNRAGGGGGGGGGANNYTNGISFSNNRLTLTRTGLGSLTADWDSTKYHSTGFYDLRYAPFGSGGGGSSLNYVNKSLKLSVAKDSVTFEDYVNAKTFNAVGDGTTNDLTAITNAKTNVLANGKQLFFPKGIYKITGNIDFGGATLNFAPGAILKGGATDTIKNFMVVAPMKQQIFDTALVVATIKSFTGSISVMWFGAKPLGVSYDNWPAFNKAIHSIDSLGAAFSSLYNYGGKIYIPGIDTSNANIYYLSKTLKIDRQIEFYGDRDPSYLQFPAYTTGLWIFYPDATPSLARGSNDVYIHDIYLYSPGNTIDSGRHGILVNSRCYLERVKIVGFGGDGVHIYGSNSNDTTSNANNFLLKFVSATSCIGSGFYTDGQDANAGSFENCSAISNYRWGFYDNSFLGNTYQACHVEASGDLNFKAWAYVVGSNKVYVCKRNNTNIKPEVSANWQNYWQLYWNGSGSHGWNNWDSTVNYVSTGSYASIQASNARNLYNNCYAEGDNGGLMIYYPAMAVGGLLANNDYLSSDVTPGRLSQIQGGGVDGLVLSHLNLNTMLATRQMHWDIDNASLVFRGVADTYGLGINMFNGSDKKFYSGNSSGIFNTFSITSLGHSNSWGRSATIGDYQFMFEHPFYMISMSDATHAPAIKMAASLSDVGSNNSYGDIIFNTTYLNTRYFGWRFHDFGVLGSGKVDTVFLNGDVPQYTTANLPSGSAPAAVYDNTTGTYKGNFGGTWKSLSTIVNLNTNTSDVGNIGAGEDDLMTYSIPAGMLATNGDYIEFTMTIKFAANANGKQVKVKYGGTTIYDSGSQNQNDGTMEITGKIIRTGATTQRITFSQNNNTTLFTDYADYVTAAETLSGAVTLKVTGTGSSDNDIVQKILIVKYNPN